MASTVNTTKTTPTSPPPPMERTTVYSAAASGTFYPLFYHHPTTTRSPSHSRYSSFLFHLLSALAAAFVIVALVSLIFYLALHPHSPQFRVNSVTLANLNTTSPTELTANFDVTLVFHNPNKKLAVLYQNLYATIRYGQNEDHAPLASSRLEPFMLSTQSEAKVRVLFSVVHEHVDGAVMKRMNDDRASGSVNFEVTLFAFIRFKAGIMHSRDRSLKVVCYPVTVSFLRNNGTGTFVGPSNLCVV